MALEAMQRNGHNLHLGQFDPGGVYDVPILSPVTRVDKLTWLPFNRVIAEANPERCGIHFFMDDYIFERCWHDPTRYAQLLLRFGAVMSPDFSLFTDDPRAVQIYNHWRKHQLAAYWQSYGMTVIPTICWSDRDSFEWCFDGEPTESVVAVSSVGTQKNPFARQLFLEGYLEMLCRLRPIHVIFYGDIPDECRVGGLSLESVPAYHHSLANDRRAR